MMQKESTSKIGDNSGVSGEVLAAFVNRIEKLQDQASFIGKDIRGVYDEAGFAGFDKKTIRKLIADRKIPEQKLNEQYEMLDLYKCAIARV